MNTIGASELILNPRGSVYHLDLRPEEVADTIITVGDPDRVKEVSKHFDKVSFKQHKREFVTHTGRIGQKNITVISTGIGTDNIDIVINELDALFNIDLETRQRKNELQVLQIIRIGTSGSLQKEIPVDSFVASEFAIGLDNLLNFYRLNYSESEKTMLRAFHAHMHEEHIAFIPYLASASKILVGKFSGKLKMGVTVTCPGFYAPQGRTLRVEPAFSNLIDHLTSFNHLDYRITNFEMETAGLYGMAKVLGHQALSLNAVVANRIEKKFSKNPDKTVEKLIKMALEGIS